MYKTIESIPILDEIFSSHKTVFYKHTKLEGTVRYWNFPAAFDIEDSSFYLDGEKVSTMYVWQTAFDGTCILGRTWEEFYQLCEYISHNYCDYNNRLLVYVHYLNHEFAFMQELFEWSKVFCSSERSPIYALSTMGIEFRDSYILSGTSLDVVAKNLTKYKINKLKGDLDYDLIRGSETPLTDEELGYCVNDVLVLNAYIQEKIENEGDIAKIPLTNTGYVRKYLKDKCLPRKDKKSRELYKALMKQLTIEPEHYPMLKRAFSGGFTHANALYVGDHIKGIIDSYDFTSSYPAVMLAEYYPMSKATVHENIDIDDFRKLLKDNLCIFNITFYNICMKDSVHENIISESKVYNTENVVSNNGRVVSADKLTTTITNIDFEMILNFYDFEEIQLGTVLSYKKGFLPKSIIESVLHFYQGKTTLKGIDDQIVMYMLLKGMLNACYGCMVTDIIKELTEFISGFGWEKTIPDMEEAITKYNEKDTRFLYYPWGIFITAYARRNLMTGILEFGEDYIYSDTDSLKVLNREKHLDYINWYNEQIASKIDYTLNYYGLDPELARPKTVKGVQKQIGVWDWETEGNPYTEFKTLGAKRYMYTEDGHIHITIAGLSKSKGADYISEQSNPYDFFDDKMYIPETRTGKLTHTYIDEPREGYLTDYLGNRMYFKELTSVHLEKASFSISETDNFKEYVNGYKESFRR